MLATTRLGKAYARDRWAVRHLDLIVPNGKLVMLLGANGAGKSTTINCFFDFIRPTEGTASVDEHIVATAPLDAKRNLAFLAETLAVYPSLTGIQNLTFFAGLGSSTHLKEAESAALLERMGLPGHAMHRPVREYSKGMRQKLGLGIALARRASNIILDEPTTGLDPVSARELLANLRCLCNEGAAVLMSTHDVFRAASDADHIYVMRTGELVAEFEGQQIAGLDVEAEYVRIAGAA
ncbi:MAG: transporter related protein [Gemmatimonadetes bacterium]|nr:transporter related protein [Gemmatimonadota bacterium]